MRFAQRDRSTFAGRSLSRAGRAERGGKCYQFEEVPPDTFAAFKAAFAKGRYFNDHIRNHFRYRVVATGDDAG
ncbi:KTSC domain-containing protein [Mesorhizobium sp. M6A.T.Cr.TU.016.01.1.1]|nr:KTSC domain-containing protein [Mesorhizobium sp. M6A.T.Cr.TU.016.01.1.1]